MAKHPGGRPSVITPDVLQKLEEAFSWCCSDEEAALHAGISPRALYYYQNKHPKYLQRKQQLRLKPNLAVKKNLTKDLEDNDFKARWWAEHKMSDEFGNKVKVEHAGKVETEDVSTREAAKDLAKKFEAELFKLFTAPKIQEPYGDQEREATDLG